MGLLTRQDSKIYRGFFNEMCKLIGQTVGYQYVIKQKMTIHSEDNSDLSMPIRLNIIFDENPSIATLNKMGWVAESLETKPVIANLPYNTPNLTVNARIHIETVEGTKRPRVFRITSLKSDLEFPDAYTCTLVPVYDQIPQKNQYTLINNEKLNQEASERTSKDQPYSYITGSEDIDTTPEKHKEWSEEFNYLNTEKSPYSD